MKRILFILSIVLNVFLISLFAYKKYNNWFENDALKLPFRTSIFNAAPKAEGLTYFIGDSHTEGFELNEYLNDPKVRNRGIWGDLSSSVLKRIDSVATLKPDKIFLMIGVNDILSGNSVEKTFDNVTKTIEKIQLESPSTAIYIQSVLPTNNPILHSDATATSAIIRLNTKYKSLENKAKVKFINLYPAFVDNGGLKKELNYDGLHLTGKGYVLWSSLIKQYL
jgi:lysophospholipase L1-like esterase